MDRISEVDRLVTVLRERLLERAKTAKPGRKEAPRDSQTSWVENLKALAAIDAVPDHQLRRALIQNILADQFGRNLLNETKFQQVVERVTEALEADESGSVLLDRLVAELRSASR